MSAAVSGSPSFLSFCWRFLSVWRQAAGLEKRAFSRTMRKSRSPVLRSAFRLSSRPARHEKASSSSREARQSRVRIFLSLKAPAAWFCMSFLKRLTNRPFNILGAVIGRIRYGRGIEHVHDGGETFAFPS
jgi:hypothetical protein